MRLKNKVLPEAFPRNGTLTINWLVAVSQRGLPTASARAAASADESAT
ncbi:MAG: hypothetical protein ABWX63_02865 [Paeniglutamicibacter terrestris]